ncbi:MAG: AraC family transcriptional regulator [Flavobacteriaceae bacterium]|nr:MAG: AraC family transcriptional regulator [Flavobacteriaceae bacterium]
MNNLLYIKNMVCPRCISAVSEVLTELQIETTAIQLGEISLRSPISLQKRELLATKLVAAGFELILDKNSTYITQIKTLIIDSIRNNNGRTRCNYSVLIAEKLDQEYAVISKLFSSIEGITIEKYGVKQKIEYVKELLFYKELTLSEISFKLDYSSVAHLSSQFKQQTGMTPSAFKKLKGPSHSSLDSL